MKVLFSAQALEQYAEWAMTDRKTFRKLNTLIEDCRRHPFTGLGKPEALRHLSGGWWSRRISQEHRLIYRVAGLGDDQRLEIQRCHGHYT